MRYVIYHSPCLDGFAARWAAWKALGDDDVAYVGADYGDPIPEIEDPDEADVVMVDVSWPRGDLLRMRDRVRDLVVLDHHKTARDDLQGLEFAHFDMDRSGARLAWEFFHPGTEAPDLIRYVEDRDLWRFALGDRTREVNALLQAVGFDIEEWDRVGRMLEGVKAHIVFDRGRIVMRRQQKAYQEGADGAHRVTLPNGGDPLAASEHVFLAVNVALKSLVSGTLHLLLDEYDEDCVVAYRRMGSGEWNYSLRSVEGFDCSRIAKGYGGGGHPQAAGFNSDLPPEYAGPA